MQGATILDLLDVLRRRPRYVVLFAAPEPLRRQFPVEWDGAQLYRGTYPHQLDRQLLPAIPPLRYCLHLPASVGDLSELPISAVQPGHAIAAPHDIRLLPASAFHDYLQWDDQESVPGLVLVADSEYDAAADKATSLGFALPPLRFSDISSESLAGHWSAMQEAFLPPEIRRLEAPHVLLTGDNLLPTELPLRKLERQLGFDHDRYPPAPLLANESSYLARAFNIHAASTAIIELVRHGVEEDSARLKVAEQLTLRRMKPEKLPFTLAVPGVAPAYRRALRMAAEEAGHKLDLEADGTVERDAIALVAAHDAGSRGGVGLVTPDIPAEAYVRLAHLEQHWSQAKIDPKAKAIRGLFRRLNKAAEPFWTDALVRSIQQSSTLSVISNFPLGLLTLPGDTSPLCCRLPVQYRPLSPLTRMVQSTLASPSYIDFSRGFRILVAECIPINDSVGVTSREAWDIAEKDLFESAEHEVIFERVDVQSAVELRRALADHAPDVLVLSAHGQTKMGVAGLVIGDEWVAGPEIGEVPPFVVLSACSVSPRGRGEVGVADLLQLQGAVAVLGTQVPVSVMRNALLTARLLLYMTEATGKGQPMTSLSEAWHHVLGTNTINDITYSSPKLLNWIMEEPEGGVSVSSKFMMERSLGRLRPAHVYQDTETVLLELADEQGLRDRVRGWTNTPGYIPESLFYLMMGFPDRILLTGDVGSTVSP